MKSKLFDTIRDAGKSYTWSPDSKYLLFTYFYSNFTVETMLYSVETRSYEQFLKDRKAIYMDKIDSRGRIYYSINNNDVSDSSLYYFDFNKAIISRKSEQVKTNLKIDAFQLFSFPLPVYGNESYFINFKNTNYFNTNDCRLDTADLKYEFCTMYKLDTNFNIFSESNITFDDPDYYNINNLEPPHFNTYGNKLCATKNNEIFIYLNVRHLHKLIKIYPKYWDSTTIRARNKSGYYRMDTNCGNMKQLVRMWANVGGITATGDGETIYYGYMKRNKNCVIMKMDRYGKNKEVIIDLEYFEGQTSIDDTQTIINNISYYPNPTKDKLNIRLDCEPIANEEIEIYDLMGQNIITQKIENTNTNVNLQELNTGIYYCKLKQNGTVFKFEVVK